MKFFSCAGGSLCSSQQLSQPPRHGSGSVSGSALHIPELTAAIFKSRWQKLQFFVLVATLHSESLHPNKWTLPGTNLLALTSITLNKTFKTKYLIK